MLGDSQPAELRGPFFFDRFLDRVLVPFEVSALPLSMSARAVLRVRDELGVVLVSTTGAEGREFGSSP